MLWFLQSTALGAPLAALVKQGIKLSETATITSTENPSKMELEPREEENWESEEFVNYVKDILANKCQHMEDNKTCKPSQDPSDFDKLNSTEQETIRKFMGGSGGSRKSVTCAQLVRKRGDDDAPENVACILYFYDQNPLNGSQINVTLTN
ncbi:hypothetical protein GE061_006113 [Apolygus lucorum]|uniref:Uncharacterized protein n=1 Tax=Apolygus lucorum TaxID=248454 RepID=A0A8S9WWX8_APOLU|nr:hypothetical protein GE061_006113 [Apolygus lucorum]